MMIKHPWLWLFSFFLLTTASAMAQDRHYMYIQSDDRSPFFIQMDKDKKRYMSNESGFLIISQIAGGSHQFVLGAPGKKEGRVFKYEVNSDAAYSLRQSEKGWDLMNLQSGELIQGNVVSLETGRLVRTREPDPAGQSTAVSRFADMLSEVVDDPSLRDNPSFRGIRQAGSSVSDSGRTIVFLDVTPAGTDTVTAFIPAAAAVIPPASTVVVETASPNLIDSSARRDSLVAGVPTSRPDSSVTLNRSNAGAPPKDTAVAIADHPATPEVANPFYKKEEAAPVVPSPVFNSNCTAQADDRDLIRLKKRMGGETDDDYMIEVARKAFRSKCYSTVQVRELGKLFYTDQSRYNFYQASYPFVYDVSAFASLESGLLDKYYKDRFRELVKH